MKISELFEAKEKPQKQKAVVRVRVRKHPMGMHQPTGTFNVHDLTYDKKRKSYDLSIQGGEGGWTLADQPPFMTFMPHDSSMPISMGQALVMVNRSKGLKTDGKGRETDDEGRALDTSDMTKDELASHKSYWDYRDNEKARNAQNTAAIKAKAKK